MATSAKEESKIASIKEQAELIKQDLNVKDKAGEARLTRGNLVKSITEELGGIRDSYTSIVNDGKYVVKVDEALNITVEKYTGEILEQGELGIILTPSTTASSAEAVRITVDLKIGGMQTYQEYADDILATKTQAEKEQYFVEGNRAYMETNYPDEEVTVESILRRRYNGRYDSLELFAQDMDIHL